MIKLKAEPDSFLRRMHLYDPADPDFPGIRTNHRKALTALSTPHSPQMLTLQVKYTAVCFLYLAETSTLKVTNGIERRKVMGVIPELLLKWECIIWKGKNRSLACSLACGLVFLHDDGNVRLTGRRTQSWALKYWTRQHQQGEGGGKGAPETSGGQKIPIQERPAGLLAQQVQ